MNLIKLLKTLHKYYTVHNNYSDLQEGHKHHEEANLANAKEKADDAILEYFSDFIGGDVKAPVSCGITIKDVRQEVYNQVEKMEKHLKKNALDTNVVSKAINAAVDGLRSEIDDLKKSEKKISEKILASVDEKISAAIDDLTKPKESAPKKKQKDDLI